MKFVYRLHAVERMFERDIAEEEVEDAVKSGIVIETYPDDKPYPSFLSLFKNGPKPLHVVYALTEEDTVVVITVYRPDGRVWEPDLRTRKEKQ